MDKCKKYSSQFDRYLDSELKSKLSQEDIEAFGQHLRTCTKCTEEFENLKNTMIFMYQRERPEPDADFMENFWDNLEPQLKPEKKSEFFIKSLWENILTKIQYQPKWGFQFAGAVSILLIGILIGKYFISGPEIQTIPQTIPNNLSIQQASTIEQADRYINRSQVLLLGLMNMDPEVENLETINLDHKKTISRELLTQASALKKDLNNPSQRQLKGLIADLEVILLQIATLEIEQDLSGIELIQNGIDRKGIFLKINIREMDKSNDDSVQQDDNKNNDNKSI